MKKHVMFIIMIFITTGCSSVNGINNLPTELSNKYQTTPSPLISDEFNKTKLDTNKWTYRKRATGGLGRGPNFVKFETEADGTKYVSLKGYGKQLKGSGISTLTAVNYGFYETKWKVTGIDKDIPTSFHPAIWSYWGNSGEISKKFDLANKHSLEIDLMEFGNWPKPVHWSSDAPAFYNGKRIVATGSKHESDIDFDGDKAVMIDAPNNTRVNYAQWTTLGMEYTAEYIQMWEQTEGKWKKAGRRINFANENTLSSINKKHRNKMYWLLSNLFLEFGGIPKDRSDTSLDVDYFRFYPNL